MARILSILLAAAVLASASPLLTAPAHADPVRRDPVVVEAAWARATVGAETTTAVYFTVRADPGRGDRLLGASSPLAETAELYARETREATTSARAVKSIDVPAGGHVTLAPGSAHVMLSGLAVALAPGDNLPVTLLFADAGRVTITVPVLPRSALGPGAQR